ncbi:hypothetical protein [Morganella morganii]|uniref:hypothetical protein n=1 Tax=Morganella morganii TaxID=582 RepID=UPI0021A522A3|nr:hypothetical protein [Morganella morganii]
MAILEKIAGWCHFHPETQTTILITNEQQQNGAFSAGKETVLNCSGYFQDETESGGALKHPYVKSEQ